MKKILNNRRGFTLIELLVVISIISLLTSIVLSSLSDAKAKGRDTARIRSMIETRTALQMYFSDKGYYPQSLVEIKPTYIKEVNSTEIAYSGTTGIGGTVGACTSTGSTCIGYHLGIKLEKNNPVLTSDSDTIIFFPGNTVTCNGIPSGTDLCYDLVQ